MNAKVFRFEDNSAFHSPQSSEFARLLLTSCDSTTRKRILEAYGLEIVSSGQVERVRHDGRKIGIGFFRAGTSGVSFQVTPKEHVLGLRSIFQALGTEYIKKRRGYFEKLESLAPVEQGEDDFSVAFLFDLLNKIAAFAKRFDLALSRKKEVVIYGGVKGRPLLQKSLRNILLGRGLGWSCEVLDNSGLQDYIVVLVATAQDIVRLIQEWQGLLLATGETPENSLRAITTHLGTRDTSTFSMQLLSRVCRPPFPFGLREMLYKCLRYWKWRGRFQTADASTYSSGYYGLVVQMDKLFEDYVGAAWNCSLDSAFRWVRNRKFNYQIHELTGMLVSEKPIEPDHLFIDTLRNRVIIVDAKYSMRSGEPDNIYQMLSYLNFNYPADNLHLQITGNSSKVGVLVYPGHMWKVNQISNFNHSLYLVTLPVTETLVHTNIADFIASLTTLGTCKITEKVK